jgi:hypothetical protein
MKTSQSYLFYFSKLWHDFFGFFFDGDEFNSDNDFDNDGSDDNDEIWCR